MAKDALVQQVLARAQELAVAYGKGRQVVQDYSVRMADTDESFTPSTVKAVADSAISAFDGAKDAYNWLNARLGEIKDSCGALPRDEALFLLNVFHAMHANASALQHYASAAEMVEANLSVGHATRAVTDYREGLRNTIGELIRCLAGQPHYGLALNGIANWAVDNLKASMPVIHAATMNGGHSSS